MNILKSLHAGLLHRTFVYGGKPIFAASLLWGFKMDSGEPVLEQKLWTTIGEMLGKNEMFDAGMPKTNGEVLVSGSFFSPHGKPVQGGKISLTIGPIHKELAVFGDRRWVRKFGTILMIEGPEPFTEMPVAYANAFGGEGFAKNPTGKGFAPVQTGDGHIHALPNIEYPDRLIGSPDDRPDPAGFSRQDITWSRRLAKAGTYDEKYIQERMPGLPDDIDWTFFNDAAPDQWLKGFFAGRESFEIANMNPGLPLLRGKLPGVYGRCFVNRMVDGLVLFKEIKTRLDTVWFFPKVNLGVLIHRGSLEVSEDDGTDVKQLLIAHENISDPPRDLEHYRAEMNRRSDPETAALSLLNTAPLIPIGCPDGFKVLEKEIENRLEGLGARNVQAYTDAKVEEAKKKMEAQKDDIARRMEEAGLAPNTFPDPFEAVKPEPSPEAEKMKELIEKAIPGAISDPNNIDFSRIDLKKFDEVKAYTDQLTAEKIKEAENRVKKQIEEIRAAGTATPEMEASIAKVEKALAGEAEPADLPRLNVREILESTRNRIVEAQNNVHMLQSMGVPQDQLAALLDLDVDDIEGKLAGALETAVDGYRLGAHAIPKAKSPHEGQEPEIAANLIKAYKEGGATAGGDYAFVDLSGLDLSGIDLSGAYLEWADLSGANLTGAILRKAILAHANLTGADFTGADLREANIGATTMTDTRFVDADLTGAILCKARIKGAAFHRCKLLDRMEMFLETEFENVDFTGCDMRKSNFLDVDISGCHFPGSDLTESNFISPVMRKTVFDGAILQGVNFIKAEAPGASFQNTAMKNVRFVGGCNLTGALLIAARAPEANFRDCILAGADFSQADISKSDFGGADLTGARFIKAVAIQTQFNKANLERAILHRINLMEGSLHKARLTGAKFIGANLFSVDFFGCKLGETDFTQANLERTIIEKWRP